MLVGLGLIASVLCLLAAGAVCFFAGRASMLREIRDDIRKGGR